MTESKEIEPEPMSEPTLRPKSVCAILLLLSYSLYYMLTLTYFFYLYSFLVKDCVRGKIDNIHVCCVSS